MLAFIDQLWCATVNCSGTLPDERSLLFTHTNSRRICFGQTVGGGSSVWMSSIMCLGKSFLLSLQTPSSLPTAVCSVPPSGPQLKTIKSRWNFLFTLLWYSVWRQVSIFYSSSVVVCMFLLSVFSPSCKGYPCFYLDKVCQSTVFDPP